jgi:plasmid stabilization system protein ParE
MSEGYRVLWTAVAENDLREIILFIARDCPANALSVLREIRARAAPLFLNGGTFTNKLYFFAEVAFFCRLSSVEEMSHSFDMTAWVAESGLNCQEGFRFTPMGQKEVRRMLSYQRCCGLLRLSHLLLRSQQ